MRISTKTVRASRRTHRADGFYRFSNKPVNSTVAAGRGWLRRAASRRFDGMRKIAIWVLAGAVLAALGCRGEDDAAGTARPAAKAEPRRVPQVQPPIDVKAPPKDAAKTASGLSYKRLVEKSNGLQARSDEAVLIRYTGWRQESGETFFTTGTDGQAITINPAYAGLIVIA